MDGQQSHLRRTFPPDNPHHSIRTGSPLCPTRRERLSCRKGNSRRGFHSHPPHAQPATRHTSRGGDVAGNFLSLAGLPESGFQSCAFLIFLERSNVAWSNRGSRLPLLHSPILFAAAGRISIGVPLGLLPDAGLPAATPSVRSNPRFAHGAGGDMAHLSRRAACKLTLIAVHFRES